MKASAPNRKFTSSFRYRFVRLAYSALWYCLIAPLSVVFCVNWLMRKEGYSKSRLSRFSLFPSSLQKSDVLWHCVSVGEVTAVTPLVSQLLALYPTLRITISTTTPTGAARVKQQLGNNHNIQHVYLPYDCGWFMRRLLARLTPSVVLITEVEVWPNLIANSVARQIPVGLINARMTERSMNRYKKLGVLFSETLSQLSFISAQSSEDKARYIELGASSALVTNSGNLKFDITFDEVGHHLVNKIAEFAKTLNRSIIVAASTHNPEEHMLIAAFRGLKETQQNPLLCIVPRHPQRFDEVAAICKQSGFNIERFSSMPTTLPEAIDIVVVDAMGVLNACYAIADMAFVGGSFAERGGHNALEAAACNIPIIMGPSQFNNPQICSQLEEAGALVTASDQRQLNETLLRWINDKHARQIAGKAGRDVIEQNRGATDNSINIIKPFLLSSNQSA